MFCFVYDGPVNATSERQLRKVYDDILRNKNKICLEHRSAERSKEWLDIYYAYPAPSQVEGFLKRFAKLQKVDQTLHTALQPLMDNLLLAALELVDFRAEAKKAKEARKQARAQKAADKKADRTNPYRKLDPQVAKLLKEVAIPFRQEAYDQMHLHETNFVNKFAELAKEAGSFDPNIVYPTKDKTILDAQAAMEKRHEADRFVVRENGDYKLVPIERINEIISAKANRYADDLQTNFILRVGTKLSDLVEKKGNLDKTEISGSFKDHWMTLTFTDGSSFQVQSQVVWKTSVNGVHFPQFPTCFRNVKLSNGTKMELPSEAKMKKAFVPHELVRRAAR